MMAYLHCHSCDWSQDEFWSKDYTPLKSSIVSWLGDLLLEDTVSTDEGPGKGVVEIESRMYVSRALVRIGMEIRNMKWKTEEDWLRERETAVCPNCGAQDFDID